MERVDHYRTLGAAAGASHIELRTAYRREGHDYRRAFHVASLKAATVVFLLGLAVLTLSR